MSAEWGAGHDTPAQLLQDFQARRLDSHPMERTLALVRHNPPAALALVLRALETLTERTTFLDAAISYVADEDLPTLADAALKACVGTPGHDLAQEVLAYIALQRPTVLHPHLDLLFEVRPNVGTYYETYPWRESGDRHLAFLAPYLRGEPESPSDRDAARERLLEARSPATLRAALFPENGPVQATSWDQYGGCNRSASPSATGSSAPCTPTQSGT